MIGQLLQVTLTLGFICAESNKHFEHMKPSFTAPFDVLTFDILTREMVTGSGFGSWWIEVFEKMLTGYLLLSSSCFLLILYFTASHFFLLSALTESLAQAICIQSIEQKILHFYTSLNLEHK